MIRVGMLFALSIALFGMVRWLPGDPATAFARASDLQETPQYIAQLQQMMGLDQPFFLQWWNWWTGMLTGDFGVSWVTQQPFQSELLTALAHTAWISVQALVFAVIVSIPLAVISARADDKARGKVIAVVSRFITSMPPMAIACLLVLLFSIQLSWLPVQGARSWIHSILPSLTLGIGVAAMMVLLLRESLLECARHESVRFARIHHVPERIIWYRYILKRALAPFLTWSGIQLANLLCGAFIVEYWFAWPGFGRYFIDAVEYRDYPVIQTCMLFMAIFFTMINGGAEWWRKRLEQRLTQRNV
jgi:nickel transport system permease protein